MNILYKMINLYHDARLFVKSTHQRCTKGFAYKDTWNLDSSLARWIIPRLKHFRNNTHSMPGDLENSNGEKCLTMEEWQSILDKMIYAFEFVLKEDDIVESCYPKDYDWGFTTVPDKNGGRLLKFNDDRKPDFTYHEECKKKYDEGMKLFVLYFRHLWD